MEEKEIEKIVQNMVENSYRGDAAVEVQHLTDNHMFSSDLSATAKVFGVPKDVKISNNRWHEGNGYEMDFRNSQMGKEHEDYGKVNFWRVEVEKSGETLLLDVVIPI